MSLNLTDIIFLFSVSYFAFIGWRKGFLRSLNGPISLIICAALGALYFKKTQNVMLSLAVTIIGPLMLNIFLGLVLDILQKADNRLNAVSFFSRLGGMFINLGWSGSMLLLSVLLLSIIPAQLFGMREVKENVLESKTYSLMIKLMPLPFSPRSGSYILTQEWLDSLRTEPEAYENLERMEEFKALMSDPRIREIFTDEETLSQIKQQDMAGLLANKKILVILQDPELVKKFFNMYKQIQNIEQKPAVLQKSLP